jgi:hypothetical protein
LESALAFSITVSNRVEKARTALGKASRATAPAMTREGIELRGAKGSVACMVDS